ncbi:MAG: sigma-70 family RNA polymerase sigma factor [Anaerofustis sp.]
MQDSNEMKNNDEELWAEYERTKSVEIRNYFVEKYAYLAKYIATKTTGGYQYFNHFEDVVHEGVIALVDAAEKFDLKKNIKFETYASIKIKGAIIDYIRKQDLFSRRVKKIARNLNDAVTEFIQINGKIPSNEELSKAMGISLDSLEKMQYETHSLQILSFEELAYENGVKNLDLDPVSIPNTSGPEGEIEKKEMTDILADSIGHLKENEQMVISLYYRDGLKIKEIAEVLDISSSRVSQIHSSALQKLKNMMGNYMQV